MAGRSHNEPPSHLNELGEVLRLAVHGVRSTPPPRDRMQRALDEARRLGPPSEPRRRLRPWMVLTTVAILALGMVAYGLRDVCFTWSTPPGDDGRLDSTEVDLRRPNPRPPLIDVDVLPVPPRVEAISGVRQDGGPYFLHACIHLDLPARPRPGPAASHVVFFLDTSTGKHPERFDLRVKLLRKILESDPDIRFFNILVPGAPATWAATAGWLRNNPEDRAVLAKLHTLPRPATASLADACDQLGRVAFPVPKDGVLHAFLLVGDALDVRGADPASLATRLKGAGDRRLRLSCYCTTPGDGNGPVLEALATSDGGVYACSSESDLAAAAAAYREESFRLESIRFVQGPGAREVRTDGMRTCIYPGGALCVGAQFAEAGRTTLVIEGTFAEKKVVDEVPLEVRDGDEKAANAYAELPAPSAS
jgi:hypothetical protein